MKNRSLISLFLLVLAVMPAAQQPFFAPGRALSTKERVFGIEGAMIPARGAIGPYADLDGDGDIDFLHSARAYRNNGSGIFGLQRRLGLEEFGGSFFHANGDGALDLLTRTRLYLGDGSGGFDDASTGLPAGGVYDRVAIADFDGDLDLDLASVRLFAFPDPATVGLALGDGAGHFVDGTGSLPPIPAGATAIAATDVDGDGDPDLYVGASADVLWRNDGTGSFTPSALPSSALGTEVICPVDVDGDLDTDLVLGAGPLVRLYANDGTGSFSEHSLPLSRDHHIVDLLAADVDGDGDMDVLAIHEYLFVPPGLSRPARLELLLNDGSGVFTLDAGFPLLELRGRRGQALDLDGDGDTDFVVEATDGNRVLLNDGAGAFLPVPGAPRRRIDQVADLNGDGLPDGFSPYETFVNAPPGVLTSSGVTLPALPLGCDFFQATPPSDVALGDVDGDGNVDAYIAMPFNECSCPFSYCQYNRLWIGDGEGGFVDETDPRLPEGIGERVGIPKDVELLALDGDGDLDAFCVRRRDLDGSGGSSAYVNDGTGRFTAADTISGSNAGGLGDFDGDGDADYFEGGESFIAQPDRLHLNDGGATFTPDDTALPLVPAFGIAYQVVPGDVDGDGDLDVYVSRDGDPPSLYMNDGTGHFIDEPARVDLRLTRAARVRFVDIDDDGDEDLVGGLAFHRNDGRGVFEDARASSGPWSHDNTAAIADRDLDGDLDLWSAGNANLTRHLEVRGPARIGQSFQLVVHGEPWAPYALIESSGTTRIPLPTGGYLLVDLVQILSVNAGTLGRLGVAKDRRSLPANPALLGLTSYWQAFVGRPNRPTNLAITTVVGN